MTPTADNQVTPAHPCTPAQGHQEHAHQVPFNLDDAPELQGPVHTYFNELGAPYDPAAPEDIEPPAARPLHDRWGDCASSSDCDMETDSLQFIRGSATHGDVHDFSYAMTRLIRGGRKASYSLHDQLQAWSAHCDKSTDREIQVAIAEGFRTMPIPVPNPVPQGGGVLYFASVAAAQAATPNIPLNPPDTIPPGHLATLQLFAQWFKETFPRVESVREAKRQVEFEFGQTQALLHHNAEFNELLDRLPTGSRALLQLPGHIDHYLSSLSPDLPAELAGDYEPPRKSVVDEHATCNNGTGFATLQRVQTAAIDAERMVSAAARDRQLPKHWVDYAGRKKTTGRKKATVGSIEMADAPLTQSSSRALMAGYADSAANKLRIEFGGRIDSLETGMTTFGAQLATVDTKIERQHSEVLQAVRNSSKGKGGYGKGGGQGNKGKWRSQQQQPLQPRFPQQQQQQQWQQQPQWQQQQQQAPQSTWQSTVPAPQRQGAAAAGQSWASGRKPLACWGCGGPHMERNCPNKGMVDASIAATRYGADVCNLALSGDDSGDATLEEVEARFGSLEEVRGFVNAVRIQSEEILVGAVQQGSLPSHPAHTDWSHITHSLTHSEPLTAPEWNRLYIANSLNLRPCTLLYETADGTARLMFRCDYSNSNGLGQLKDSDRLLQYVPELVDCHLTDDLTEIQRTQLQESNPASRLLATAQQAVRQREPPLNGVGGEGQVIPGTEPTPPKVAGGTTKVSCEPESSLRESSVGGVNRHPVSTASSVSVVSAVQLVHCDINCVRDASVMRDCLRSKQREMLECSSLTAGTAPSSPALSPHVSPSAEHTHTQQAPLDIGSSSQRVPVLPVHSEGSERKPRAEYPPDLATELRGDLAPLGPDCVIPMGLQSDSIFDFVGPDCVIPMGLQSDSRRGKIHGLVAATVVGDAATVPLVAQSSNVVSQCNAVSQENHTLVPRTAHTPLNLYPYPTGQPPEAQTPGGCRASFCRQPERTSQNRQSFLGEGGMVGTTAERSDPLRPPRPLTGFTSKGSGVEGRVETVRRVDTAVKRFVTLLSHSVPEWNDVTRRVTRDLATSEVLEDIDDSHPQWDSNSFLHRALPNSATKGTSTEFTYTDTGNAQMRTAPVYTVRSEKVGSTVSGSSGRCPSKPPLMPLHIDTAPVIQHIHSVSPPHLTVTEPVEGSVLRDTPNYHGTVPVADRPAIGVWNPTARSVCSMLHAADIRGRWEAIATARLRKWKKRCKANTKAEKWYERKCKREEAEWIREESAGVTETADNLREIVNGLKRYSGEKVYKFRQKLKLKAKPNVCGVETERDLITPGRTQYNVKLASDNSAPAILLYLIFLLLAGSLFIAMNASPGVNHLANTGIGSRTLVVLSAIIIMQGCRLYNGSMIAAALMATWYCLANTGSAAASGGGPLFWLDLLFPFELRMSCLLLVMCLATLIKADKPTRRAASSAISTVKDIKRNRSLNNSIAAVNENVRKLFNSAYIEIELVDSPGTIIRVLLDTGASASCFSARALRSVWHKIKRTVSSKPMNLVSAEGSSLGTNLGSTELRFRIPGQKRIYEHRIEIIDNDGVPSILGVDFLKSVGATLQFTEHSDTATWSTPGHETVTIPLHCTAPESKGTYAVTSAEGFVLEPGKGSDRCIAHIDIQPDKLRFNQSLYITPTIVTVESNNSEADDDSLDLVPTTCVRHCMVSPQLRQHGNKLTAMTTVSIKNNTAYDMVIAPGTKIGEMDIMTGRDSTICQVSREEYCADPRVKQQLKDYSLHSDPERMKEAEEVRVGIDTFQPETELPVGDWRRELNYNVPDMIRDVWKHELRGDYHKFLDRYDSEMRFGESLTAKQKEDFRLLLFIFRRAAAVDPKAPTPIKGLECRFQFKSVNPRPYSRGLPRLSPMDQSIQSEMTNTMLKAGVIEYADSEWSTGVVMAKKKGTTDKRYAVDYRGLNQELMGNVIGVPRIDDLLDHWGKANYFSTFDLASAFWSIPMRKSDKKYTAFHAYCDGGFQQYQFTIMPFGVSPGSSIFQAAFQRVVAGLDFCKVYIDDGVCATEPNDLDVHMQQLAMIFVRLEANKLTMKMPKSLWGTKKLPILGHVIKAGEGCIPDPEKVEAMLDMAPPDSITLLKSLLGAAGYLSKYIPEYASIVSPLREMDDGRPGYTDISGEWYDHRLRALEAVKAALTTAPVLAAPDFSKPWILLTDCSDNTMGACLAQLDENGVERPVAYASCNLSTAQKNYGITDKEGLAIVWAVRKWPLPAR